MGIGPLIAWRRASLRVARRRRSPGRRAFRSSPGWCCSRSAPARRRPGSSAYTFCAFVLASIALEFARGTRARRGDSGGSLARRLLRARRAKPAALRRLHRARGDRAARDRRSSGRARTTRSPSAGCSGETRCGSGTTRCLPGLGAARGSQRARDPRGGRRAQGRRVARDGSSPARTATAPSSRCRTRSRSAATG